MHTHTDTHQDTHAVMKSEERVTDTAGKIREEEDKEDEEGNNEDDWVVNGSQRVKERKS